MSDHHSDEHDFGSAELDERASAWMDVRDQRIGAGEPAGTPEDAELAERVAAFDALAAVLADVPSSPTGALDDTVGAALAAYDAVAETSVGDVIAATAVTPLARRRVDRSNRSLAAVAGLAAVALAVVGLLAVARPDQSRDHDVAAVGAVASDLAGTARAAPREAVPSTIAPLAGAPAGVMASPDSQLGTFPTLDALAASLAGTSAASSSQGYGSAADGGAPQSTTSPADILTPSDAPASAVEPTATSQPPAAPDTKGVDSSASATTTIAMPPVTARGQTRAEACNSLGVPLGVADVAGQAVRIIARADGSLAAYTLDCVTLVDQTAPVTLR